MEYSTTKNGNLLLTFLSPIGIDNGYTNEGQGEHKSTMELFVDNEGVPTMIEWDVPDLEITEHIGINFDGKQLIDFDGVFELPIQAAKLIRKYGYKVSKDMIN